MGTPLPQNLFYFTPLTSETALAPSADVSLQPYKKITLTSLRRQKIKPNYTSATI